MAFYIHLGCTLDGGSESTRTVDKWIHFCPLLKRLSIMHRVTDI